MMYRHEQILSILNGNNAVTVSDLSDNLNVSLVTIRSDLRTLEEKGLLIRTHGGAELPPVDDISRRLSFNFPSKKRIAEAAAKEVEEGETILLEAGSCIALMARALSSRKNINVLTNNAYIARQLKDSAATVLLMGGIYQKESETMVGPMVAEYLPYYNFTKVFLGMDGLTEEGGIMCRDLERAEVMSSFVKMGKKVYVLSDSAKLGVMAVRSVCRTDEIDCLITDGPVEQQFRDYLSRSAVKLIET